MDSSSSSTTVEYHDPAGVFSLIQGELTKRLPLRNLNWQSHARPLRQIKTLHVDFVPSSATLAALQPQAKDGAPAVNSIDILRSGFQAPTQSTKTIRHQIAGLKTTPYLKLYILRCDDKDWYKQEERRRLKEWLDEIKAEDGRQEHHDAAEWLIVHVVIPDTIAASEPRWRESSRDPDELRERSKVNGAKWPGKSGKTMLDRLRADFNEGKNKDRVAQIRLSKSQIAVDLLPVPAMAKTLEESADERDKSWADLMLKIRTSILSSFDARVRQYEEDIAEQEARRSFPGWNFCTFFINKEGLAKSLESVGLVEDALTIYDELSLDLETVLTDLATGKAAQTATSFSVTGTDVIDRIIAESDSQRLFNKDYREEIVRSAISAFDFFCYLFERQFALILRLAGKTAAVSGTKEGGDDLVMLAEVCWRGLNFIHNGARLLKQDLYTRLALDEAQALVLSWTFAAADFVLSRSKSSRLDLTDAGIRSPGKSFNAAQSALKRGFGFSMGADAYPQRGSSLGQRKSLPAATESKPLVNPSSTGRPSDEGFMSPPSSSGGDGLNISEVPGLAELAAYRAELIVLQRKSIDLLAAAKGWHAGWTAIAAPARGSSDTDLSKQTRIGYEVDSIICMKEAYEAKYEVLSDTAARHYLLATHQKTAENLMGDLAVLKYHQGDYEAAATYFEHVMPMFETDGWHDIQMEALALHIDCLRKLERWEYAVRASLELLAQTVSRSQDRSTDAIAKAIPEWDDILALSQQLSSPQPVLMSRFCGDIRFGRTVHHFEDKDGFSLTVSLQNQTLELKVERLVLYLESVDHAGTFLTLDHGETVLYHGSNDITLCSNVTTYGMFAVNRLEITAGKLLLSHDLVPEQTDCLLLTERESQDQPREKRPCMLIYPAENAVAMRMMLSRRTAVHKARYVEILLKTGRNEISEAEIRLRPGTAGLRLHCNDATITDGGSLSSSKPGSVTISSLSSSASASVYVKYTLEQVVAEISIFAEMQYSTPFGTFTAMQHYNIPTLLSLDVEVKDAFHLSALFSTFTIKSTNTHPVVLESVKLQGCEVYDVVSPPAVMPAIVLPQQPFDCLHRISRKKPLDGVAKQDAALTLVVDYWPISDLIRASIAGQMRKSLASSTFSALRRVLMPLLLSRCVRSLENADLHNAALSHDTKVPSFADMGWYDVVDTLPETQQRPLSDWLMQWHIKHQRVPLRRDLTQQQKQITLTVDVPTIDHVFLASLSVTGPSPAILRQGELSAARLNIRYTRKWQGTGPTKSSRRPDFVYELLIDPSAWLISGSRRACFTAEEAEGSITACVQLLPLKSGRLILPGVVIRPVLDGESNNEVSCEASCTSAGHVVEVVSNQQTSRAIAVNYEGEPRAVPLSTI